MTDSSTSQADSSPLHDGPTTYVTAALRDPRRFPFGYLAVDPGSGARGAFLWFGSRNELCDGLCTVEVALLALDDEDSRRITHSLRRVLEATPSLARISPDALSAALEGWSEIAWIGCFHELCERGGELPTSLRAEFRRQCSGAGHAGPIADEELPDFVRFLADLSGIGSV